MKAKEAAVNHRPLHAAFILRRHAGRKADVRHVRVNLWARTKNKQFNKALFDGWQPRRRYLDLQTVVWKGHLSHTYW